MIPPRTKSLTTNLGQKYINYLKSYKNSSPVLMLGEMKLDRIDLKLMKQSQKLNQRELNKNIIKIQEGKKKYEKRKAAITYRSYTVDFKRRLIEKIRQISLKTDAGLSKIIRSKAKQLNIHPKNIFRWFHTKQIKKKQGGRKALYPKMQERLAQFIINNPKMKRMHILRQAKKIMEDLDIPGHEYFNFSKGWYERFRERLIKKKIIPGKIKTKKEPFNNSDQDQEFDENSPYSLVKKQENDEIMKNEYFESMMILKQEDYADEIKYLINNQIFYGSSESDEGKSQQEQEQTPIKQEKEEQTNYVMGNLLVFYDYMVDQEKTKSHKNSKMIHKLHKQSAITNTSEQKSFRNSFNLSKQISDISLFIND